MRVSIKHLLCAVLFFLSANAYAAEASQPTLSTTGYGQVIAKPDMAEFSVAIQSERTQAKQAKMAVDKVVEKLMKSLESSNIDRKDIESSNLQITPQYIYPKDGKPQLSGYRAVRNITVTVKQLDKLNDYLDLALQSGINRVDSIQLKVQDEAKYKEQARQLAIDDAKSKAASLTKGFDATVNGVWSIEYRSNISRPVVAKSMAMESRVADQGYQDQSIMISDQVSVVFLISNK
ncbi:oxidative stress defense protein [Vibrio rumoiensis]|uniref:Oxidative stress defense protein n=1 Tax=Vibrio rumoiensis 1S-45 TaxID=1188252 RepID=A0A1E5E4K8_9VIBR|nr:oxidative stress defense protein [Vibrio rumoiensis]OEF27766.1 oxidative stress defense protein [Vibrio rumoiensis 1S-45]